MTVNTVKSNWGQVSSEISQCSVLGPVHVIFINGMPDGIQNCIQMFADDTKLYTSILNEEDDRAIQQVIKELEYWSHKWQMWLNALI